MNELQRARLQERIAPGHECTPYNGACHLPHYWHNHGAPRYLEQWPEPGPARARYEAMLRERAWAAYTPDDTDD